MTQEQKELLLKDLCARLPYGIVVGTTDNDGTIPNFWMFYSYNHFTEDVRIANCDVDADRLTDFCDVRPYLFPLSSMTEEQEIEYDATFAAIVYEDGRKDSVMTYKTFDWLNKNHFDYRDLIPMELAIDATGLNIY